MGSIPTYIVTRGLFNGFILFIPLGRGNTCSRFSRPSFTRLTARESNDPASIEVFLPFEQHSPALLLFPATRISAHCLLTSEMNDANAASTENPRTIFFRLVSSPLTNNDNEWFGLFFLPMSLDVETGTSTTQDLESLITNSLEFLI